LNDPTNACQINDRKDLELGMRREITRRAFLNGVALTVGAAILPSDLLAAAAVPEGPEKSPDYYPPALKGLRGSHPGSFDAAHSLRDGTFWEHAGSPIDTDEKYDLVVVGGGISGLSAAHFFRKAAAPKARVLVLDNHDDFGGHAKRNEFRSGQRTMLGFGGTFSIESPAPYSAVARGLIEELGIDVPSYSKYVTKGLYR
jgi:spermidine dehydrogenase